MTAPTFPPALVERCAKAAARARHDWETYTAKDLYRQDAAAVLRESGHAELVAALRAYEVWEADLILTGDWRNSMPAFRQQHYDGMMKAQELRNAALRKAGETL